MFSNRRPYLGLKLSAAEFFREPVRYLKTSNTQESMMEKPYLEEDYPKMHLKMPDYKFNPRKSTGSFGYIAGIPPKGGLASIHFGDATCGWDAVRSPGCIEGTFKVTVSASHFWTSEFDFVVGKPHDSIGVSIRRLPGTSAGAWDEQDYELTFPSDANGVVTICAFASTHTLISQLFKTVVAGMPVGINLIGGSLMASERKQGNPAVLVKSTYGMVGDSCGCIEIESSCSDPACQTAVISYTTQQMGGDEVQTLTVTNPVAGCTYDWNISAGSGSLSASTGTSVDYTAPTTNADCANNPTITVGSGGLTSDTLNIAVNTYTANPNYVAYNEVSHHQTDPCSYNIAAYTHNCASVELNLLETCSYCSGITRGTCEPCCMGFIYSPPGCDGNWDCNGIICTMAKVIADCTSCGGTGCAEGDTNDTRDPSYIAAGCCPAGLL